LARCPAHISGGSAAIGRSGSLSTAPAARHTDDGSSCCHASTTTISPFSYDVNPVVVATTATTFRRPTGGQLKVSKFSKQLKDKSGAMV